MATTRNYVFEGFLDKAYEIEKEIIQDLERQGYDDSALFCIRLAMDEALINALKHGNKNDPSRTVKISYSADNKQVEISIEDEGEGFNYKELVDPTQEEHLRRTHGRGIYLIRHFMHDVSFNEKGNRITFVYNREPAPSGEFLGLRWVQKPNGLVLILEDISGFPHIDQWETRIQSFVASGSKRVVVDISRMEYVNTTILAFLVMVAKSVKEAGGQACLCGPQERVLQVLKTTNLHQLIPIYPDLDTALEEGPA
jgi:serine/threonine-protein kinase RsbW